MEGSRYTIKNHSGFVETNVVKCALNLEQKRTKAKAKQKHSYVNAGSPCSSAFFLKSSRHWRLPGFSSASLLLRYQNRRAMRMMKSPMAVRNPSTSGETEKQKFKLKLFPIFSFNISTLLLKKKPWYNLGHTWELGPEDYNLCPITMGLLLMFLPIPYLCC